MKLCFRLVFFAFCGLIKCVSSTENPKTSQTCPFGCDSKTVVGAASNTTQQCTMLNYSVCPENALWIDALPIGELPDLEVWPINLQGLAVFRSPSSSTYSLEFEWMLNTTKLASTVDVLVRGTWNTSPYCTLYQGTQSNHQYAFCAPVDQDKTEVMKLEFLLQPSNVSLTYQLTLPQDLNFVVDPSNLTAWQTVVAVAADPLSQSVSVVFQPAPPNVSAQGYVLRIMANETGHDVARVQLQANVNRATFRENLTAGHSYSVSVTPQGCTNQLPCVSSTSATVLLPDRAVTPLPPQTITTSTLSASSDDSTQGTWPTDPSITKEHADTHNTYSRNKQIIIGTVVGGVGALVLVALVCYCVHRKRVRLPGVFSVRRLFFKRQSSHVETSSNDTKDPPKVLLLYSFDCVAHETVIKKFAQYLHSPGECEVYLDLLDMDSVKDMGIHSWIQEKVELARYVIVICSTGARFKCARNRKFQMKQEREVEITESFAWSVDYVAEKIRVACHVSSGGQEGAPQVDVEEAAPTGEERGDKYIVVYFEYAGESDVPPKLDVAIRYSLMSDMLNLHCHLHGIRWETMAGNPTDSLLDTGDEMELVDRHNNNKVQGSDVPSYDGLTAVTYTQTQAGRDLCDAIDDAKTFFRNNPDWLGDLLEGVAGTPSSSQKNQDSKENSDVKESTDNKQKKEEGENCPELEESNPDKSTKKDTTTDGEYTERQKRRKKEEEKELNMMQRGRIGQNGEELSKGDVSGIEAETAVKKSDDLFLTGASVNRSSSPTLDQGIFQPSSSDAKPLFPRQLSRAKSNPNDSDILRNEFQLNSPDLNKPRTLQHESAGRRNSSTTLRGTQSLKRRNEYFSVDDSVLSNGNEDDLQLQKDIEFIRGQKSLKNETPAAFIPPLPPVPKHPQDHSTQQQHHSSDSHPIVLDIDLSEYTPPEAFITLATSRLHGLSNGHVEEEDKTDVVGEDGNQDPSRTGFVNPLFDTNANKLAAVVPSPNHFVIDFVDPSVKQKPDQLDFNFSTT